MTLGSGAGQNSLKPACPKETDDLAQFSVLLTRTTHCVYTPLHGGDTYRTAVFAMLHKMVSESVKSYTADQQKIV
jgi:hypothetical protein